MESKKDFKWTVYAVCAAALLLVLVASFLSVRLIDGMWDNMTLPMILMIGYVTVTVVSAMFLGLSERRCDECKCCSEAAAPVVEPVVKKRKPRTPKVVPTEM